MTNYSSVQSQPFYPMLYAGCRFKIHRDHLDRSEDVVAPCKVNYDMNTAKELLLLAPSVESQQVSSVLVLFFVLCSIHFTSIFVPCSRNIYFTISFFLFVNHVHILFQYSLIKHRYLLLDVSYLFTNFKNSISAEFFYKRELHLPWYLYSEI